MSVDSVGSTEAVQMTGAIRQLALVQTYVDPPTKTVMVGDSLAITPSFGCVWYRTVDLGWPDVRSSIQEAPSADGSFDTTQYTGSRSIEITGVVIGDAYGNSPQEYGWPTDVGWNSASWWLSRLAAWASPSRRYRLYLTDESGVQRYLDVRGDSFASSFEKQSADVREFTLGLVCPSGKLFTFDTSPSASPDGRTVTKIQPGSSAKPGRVYPELGPYLRNYPPAAGGSNMVSYRGTVPAPFTCSVYTSDAVMTRPRLTVTAPDGTQRTVGLDGVTIPARTTITIDTAERTVTMREDNSTTDQPLAAYLTAPLSWPVLKPGQNYAVAGAAGSSGYNAVSFTAASLAATTTITILHNAADLA